MYVITTKSGRDATPRGAAPAPIVSPGTSAQPAGIPRLVDLGADTCIPCKAMAPILIELRTEYAGRLQVDFIFHLKVDTTGFQPVNETIRLSK